jgi:hypothetical protein
MAIASQLEQLSQQYYEQEGENREEILEQLQALHQEAMRSQADLDAFKQQAPYECGGAYIPFLFWVELAQFLQGQAESRNYLQQLIQAFADSDFEEADQALLKPFLVIYFKNEKQFEIDRVESRIIRHAHPTVGQFLKKAIEFVDNNRSATKTYEEKFKLLMPYFPNFELFQLSLPELEEQLQDA